MVLWKNLKPSVVKHPIELDYLPNLESLLCFLIKNKEFMELNMKINKEINIKNWVKSSLLPEDMEPIFHKTHYS